MTKEMLRIKNVLILTSRASFIAALVHLGFIFYKVGGFVWFGVEPDYSRVMAAMVIGFVWFILGAFLLAANGPFDE